MASKRIIEVRIKGDPIEKKTKETEPKNDLDTKEDSNSLVENAIFQQAKKEAINFLKEASLYGINRHLQLTDNYVQERYLNAGINVVNRAMSMGSAVIAGFSVGGVVGAVVGAVFAVGDLAFDIFQNYDQQNIKLRQMDAQLDYQRQRAGYSLTSGSIGENR